MEDMSTPLVGTTTQPPRRWPHIVLMLAMTLPNAAISQAATVALPNEVKRMAPDYASQISGTIGAIGSLCTLFSLVVGAVSDRHSFGLWWGRRRPFIALGGFGLVAAATCWFVGDLGSALWLVGFAYLLLFVSSSFTSVISVLIPDNLPSSQHGLASGVNGVLTAVGTGVSYAVMAAGTPLWSAFGALGFLCALAAVPTIVYAGSDQKSVLGTAGSFKGRAACVDGVRGFMFDPRKHPDWLMLLLVHMGFAFTEGCAQFIQFWVGDTLDVASPLQFVGLAGVVTLVIAVVISVPVGMFSDRVGRKPFMVCAMALLAFTACSWAFITDTKLVVGSLVVSGVGAGMYLSVATAVACDTMPNSIDSAKHLAVLRVASTAGQFIAQLSYGGILGLFKIDHDDQSGSSSSSSGHQRMYSAGGYRAVFLITASMCLMGAALSLVLSTKRGKEAQKRADEGRSALVNENGV
eukprot:m51a1_g528 hypothetical protein (464) ;mRNA; r:366490-367945